MQAELLHELDGVDGEKKPVGTVLDHPDCWKLVKMGVATPHDEECLDVCEKWAARRDQPLERLIAAASAAYPMTAKGIHPEDHAKYQAGEITGYAPDGSYLPGPHAKSENHGGIVVVDD